jgi:molecular chaperone DnaJ
MTSKRDYYEVLGVDKGADDATIKKAYRTLAMRYHPDRNPDDPQAAERMKEINEAFAVLSDKEKRSIYDRYGHRGLEGFSQEDIFRGVDFGSIFEELFGGSGLGNIFESFFGRSGGRRGSGSRRSRRGADLRYDLDVTLEDIVLGNEKTIQIPRRDPCPTCSGSGAKSEGKETCKVCHGSGQRVVEQRSVFGTIRQASTCGSCGGRGSIIVDPCEECSGRGMVEKTKEISVNVPKGASSGYALRVEGEGASGEGSAGPGDLYVVLDVKAHPTFERHGDDVYIIRDVSFPLAALGGKLEEIPSLEGNGNLQVEIPEGTQNGAVLRIPGKGIPHMKGHGRGDQYVVTKVVTPTDLTKEEKDLLHQFEELRGKTTKRSGGPSCIT